MKAKDRLIVALDISPQAALALVDILGDLVSWFKVGPALLIQSGGAVLGHLLKKGKRVFLDLKFHETPDSMMAGCVQGMLAGASMLNVHCLNGREALRECRSAIERGSSLINRSAPMLLGVTVLTSQNFEVLERLRLLRSRDDVCRGMFTDGRAGERRAQIEDLAVRLAEEAVEAGLNGVVTSPLEAPAIRKAFGPDFTIVTPGIRFPEIPPHDQQRVATPRGAILAGADYIVTGRVVTGAGNPRAAAERAIAEITAAMEEGDRNGGRRSDQV